MLSSVTSGVIVLDPDGDINFINNSANELLNFSKKEAMENSQLYGSVSVKEIIALLDQSNVKISDEKIEIKNQIKSLGVHKIFINLHAEVQSSVDLEIKPVS